MLIQAYDVRIFRCGSCGGPVKATRDGAAPCQYCGAAGESAQEQQPLAMTRLAVAATTAPEAALKWLEDRYSLGVIKV